MPNWLPGLAVALAAAPAAAQPDPAAVVRKAVDAHGGAAALRKVTAVASKMAGTVTVAGQEVPFTSEVTSQVPGKLRLAMTLELAGRKQDVVQVLNGDKVKCTANGAPLPLSDAERAELVQTALMQEVTLLAPLLAGDRYTLAADPDADVGGRPAAVVKVTAKGLGDARLLFDKETGLLAKTSRPGLNPNRGPKPVTEETVLSDYKKVGGVLFPTKAVVLHDGKPFLSAAVTETKVLDAVDPKTFAVD